MWNFINQAEYRSSKRPKYDIGEIDSKLNARTIQFANELKSQPYRTHRSKNILVVKLTTMMFVLWMERTAAFRFSLVALMHIALQLTICPRITILNYSSAPLNSASSCIQRACSHQFSCYKQVTCQRDDTLPLDLAGSTSTSRSSQSYTLIAIRSCT